MTRFLLVVGEHGLVEVDDVVFGRGKVTVTSAQREIQPPAVPNPSRLVPAPPIRIKLEMVLELEPGDEAQIVRPTVSIARDDWCERIEAPARVPTAHTAPAVAPAPGAPVQEVVLARVVQTCQACPSQWNAWDAAGRYYYLKYRSGLGTVQRAEAPDDMALADRRNGLVASFAHGGRNDGEMELTEFLQRAGIRLAPGAHVTELGGAGELPSEHHPCGGQS